MDSINAIKNILTKQEERVLKLSAGLKKDPLYWFCKSYTIVTKQLLQYTCENKFSNPQFIAGVVVAFDDIFEVNLYAYQHQTQMPSLQWQKAFHDLYQMPDYEYSMYRFIKSWLALRSCLKVHIEDDLPGCLASSIKNNTSDIDSMEADFFCMHRIFYNTAKQIEREMMQEYQVLLKHFPTKIKNGLLHWYIKQLVIKNRKRSWKEAWCLVAA